MECAFQVGQKVVCVGEEVEQAPEGHTLLTSIILPVKGQVYTVRAIDLGLARETVCIRLEEIPDQEADVLVDGEVWVVEITFEASDFRPIVERKTSIELFKAMLNPSRVGELA